MPRRRETDPSIAMDPDVCTPQARPLPVPQESPPEEAIFGSSNLRAPNRAQSLWSTESKYAGESSSHLAHSGDHLTGPPGSGIPPGDERADEDMSPNRDSLLLGPSVSPRYPSTLPSTPRTNSCPSSTAKTPSPPRHPSDIQAVLNSLRRLQRDTGLDLEHDRLESSASSIYSHASADGDRDPRRASRQRGSREWRDSLTTISEMSTPLASSAGFDAGYRGGRI